MKKAVLSKKRPHVRHGLGESASRTPVPAKHAASTGLPSVVSLFCGAGGLDWGFHEEKFKIPVAIDVSKAAVRTHKRNFKTTHSVAADLIKLQPHGVHELIAKQIPAKSRIGVIGGPPCQGFSRANTTSQADDPRNQLPQLYLEIVKKLQASYTVEFVVFENVLGIRDRKHAATYKALKDGLDELGFDVTEKELCSVDFGVPQNRRRIVLSAMRKDQGYGQVRPLPKEGLRTVREAIGELEEPKFFDKELKPADIPVHENHWTMRPKSPRFSNPDDDYADGRSFKRLAWDEPSPTIAFGHREIHVHPDGRRRLSIYEAMLLQGFPEKFVLEGNLSEQVEQVSNAVPPPLGRSIAAAVKSALKAKKKKALRRG
ncbi:DNA (cytosine-5)-methyltransferase 1 [Variovorax sp. 1140]|uniref:DNA cytosine methyltransferase n=1 Tax=Variovorax atrisoli TaxID=3394203 RepID=UPI00339340FC